MFTNFKSQFLWCIMCTFLTGLFTGFDLMFIENKDVHITLIIFNILSIISTICYWKVIFSRLDLQDKINLLLKQ